MQRRFRSLRFKIFFLDYRRNETSENETAEGDDGHKTPCLQLWSTGAADVDRGIMNNVNGDPAAL